MSNCNNKEAFQPLIEFANNRAINIGEIEKDINEASILYNNAKFYYTNNEFSGALVSYSCAAVLLNSIERHLDEISKKPSTRDKEKGTVDAAADKVHGLLKCCLSAVEVLQGKVKTLTSSAGGSKDDEKKDWAKICTNLQPLVFSKGSSDCLFFSSVAGLRREKELFRTSLIFPLSYPNLYPKASKGILIYGPPGTGKTYIVKAAVNELQKTDPNVGVLFFAPSPGDLKGKYVGETEKKIEEWFTCASRAACESQLNCPGEKKFISLIFMDEFDAIAPDRNTDTTGLAANSVNTLLQMMDGINSKENVAIVAATNFPWYLDSAILRRFDTQILIDLPKKNDIMELLNIEMKKIIKFRDVKDPNAFCNAEEKKYSTEASEAPSNKKKDAANCTLECVEEPPLDLTTTAPYDKMIFDYYDTKSNSEILIAGIVQRLEEQNFSNSDISRLIKAAATYTGQLCVKNNLFYSSKMLEDYTEPEKYISITTKLKDEKTAVTTSIAVLKSYINDNPPPFPPNVYQLVKPQFVTVKYNEETYVNVKCLFYKDNELNLDDPLIKDIYIKYDTSITTSQNQQYIKDYTSQFVNKRKFDAILTFDFSFKESSSDPNTGNPLIPVSTVLINSVFKPLYDIFENVKTTIDNYKKTSGVKQNGGGIVEAKAWATQTYGLDNNEFESIENDKMFNMVPDNNSFFTTGLKRILNNQNVAIIKGEAAKMINSFNTNDYTFYSYILLYKLIYNNVYPKKNETDTEYRSEQQQEQITPNASVFKDFINENFINEKKEDEFIENIDTYLQSIDFYNNNSNYKYVQLKKIANFVPQKRLFGNKSGPTAPTTEITQNIKDYLPFPIIHLKDNTEMFIYYNKTQKNFLLTINQYKSLIPNFKGFDGLGLYKDSNSNSNSEAISIDDWYIKIDVQFFEILFNKMIKIDAFKTTYREVVGEKFISKAFDPKLDYINKDNVLVQLYLNDVFNFYKLCTITNNDNAQSYLNEYLKGFLNIIKYEGINAPQTTSSSLTVSSASSYTRTIPILELICMRIHNNFDYVKFSEIFVLDKMLDNNVFTLITNEKYNKLWDSTQAALATPAAAPAPANTNMSTSTQPSTASTATIGSSASVAPTTTTGSSASAPTGEKPYSSTYIYSPDNPPPPVGNDWEDEVYGTGPYDSTNYILNSSIGKKTGNKYNKNLEIKWTPDGFYTLNDDIYIGGLDDNINILSQQPYLNKYPVANQYINNYKKHYIQDKNNYNKSKKQGGTAKRRQTSKNKSAKISHNKSPKKNKSKPYKKLLRNKKVKEEQIQYGGAAVDDEYKALISFCFSNSEANVIKKIINKKIYIKTEIDLDKFVQQKRSGFLIGIYSTFSTGLSWVKNFLTGKSQQQIDAEKESLTKSMLEELKQKNQYLALIFKNITAIGFLAEQPPQPPPQPQQPQPTTKTLPPTNTIDDDDLLSSGKNVGVQWININDSPTMYGIFTRVSNGIKSIKEYTGVVVAGSILSVIGFGGVASAVSIVSTLIYYIFTGEFSNFLVNYFSATDVAGDVAADVAADVAGDVAAEGATKAATEGAKGVATNTWGAMFNRFAIFIAIMFAVAELYDTINMNNVSQQQILGSIFLNSILTKITDERQITVSNLKDENASTLFIKSIEKDFNDGVGVLNAFLSGVGKKVEGVNKFLFETKYASTEKEAISTGEIRKYNNVTPDPPDIRRRLTNLNIPFTSFYYALSVVKSTYVKETGEMLQKYYDNKDKFMEEYKKKTKR